MLQLHSRQSNNVLRTTISPSEKTLHAAQLSASTPILNANTKFCENRCSEPPIVILNGRLVDPEHKAGHMPHPLRVGEQKSPRSNDQIPSKTSIPPPCQGPPRPAEGAPKFLTRPYRNDCSVQHPPWESRGGCCSEQAGVGIAPCYRTSPCSNLLGILQRFPNCHCSL